MNEMSESLNICNQVIYRIKTNNKVNVDNKSDRHVLSNKHELLNYLHVNSRKDVSSYSSMEELIKHFKYWSDGIVVNPN